MILDFIFPRVCHLCSSPLSKSERYICSGCLSSLPRTRYHSNPGNQMVQRFAGIFPFVRATGHFFYSSGSEISELMQDLKYKRFGGLARYLGEIIGSELQPTGFFSDIDGIIPMPIHLIKRLKRGYNQSELIAEGIGSVTRLPIVKALRAMRPHATQTGKDIEQRRSNLRNVFAAVPGCASAGQHLILLDDVCTTGATLSEAARTFLAAYPSTRISLLTIGVTF